MGVIGKIVRGRGIGWGAEVGRRGIEEEEERGRKGWKRLGKTEHLKSAASDKISKNDI